MSLAFHDWPGLVCASCSIPYAIAVNEVFTFQVDRVVVPNFQAGVNLRITEIWAGPLVMCPVCQAQIVVKNTLRVIGKDNPAALSKLRAEIMKGESLYFYRFNNSLDASIGLSRGMLNRDMLPPDVMRRFGFSEKEPKNV